jgi:L-arabinokinase
MTKPARDLRRAVPDFFVGESPLFIARAPGRLDVMGGIADYSGARVLELPLACTTTACVQRQEPLRCDIASLRQGRCDRFSIDLPLAPSAELAPWFWKHVVDRWASYVVGVVEALLARTGRVRGLKILIDSTVPEGRGVASSAALEVATASAVAACCDIAISPQELAALCQRVENEVVGAPCGIMDQMTSACGRKDRLLQLRCQPGTIEGFVEIPAGYRFYGIDSGISHAVSGADYGTVRTAAFMGHRILTAETAETAATAWRGKYLADLTPAMFAELGRALPEEMSGADFLERYGGIMDTATTVDPGRRYPVRRAAQHPVDEQARVDRFAELLAALPQQPSVAIELGALMYGSHQSYSACGLGSEGTDRLVALVRSAGAEQGLFGAKITGGGSGGTVAVFGTSAADSVVRDVAARYATATGLTARVFAESGPGAAELGVLRHP